MTANPVARFSTDDFAPRERLSVWREQVVRPIFNADLEPLSDDPFTADATLHRFPGLRVASGATSAMGYHGIGRSSGEDAIILSFGHCDGTFARQCGRETTIRIGDAFLLRCGANTYAHVPQASRFTSLRIPRDALAMNVSDLDAAFCRPIAREMPALRLLKGYLDTFHDTTRALAVPALQHSTVTHVYDLLALIAGATRDAAALAEQRGLRAARFQAIKDDIARNLKDQALAVGVVAQRHEVTPRCVQKLFEEAGTTFTEYVVAQRLARAHRLLSDPHLAQRTLTAIAQEVGFTDLSYFNRAFRRRYGDTPSGVRGSIRRQV